ncbi:MAG: ABC transporter ATP-binding protein [Vicinamibacterales bacterium]
MSRAPQASGSLLQTENVTMQFGGLTAVKDLTMDVKAGSLFGLIGPNGAGKTTIFNMLTGVYDPTKGDVYFAGTRINGRRPSDIASLGIARTFQNIRLFSGMTVIENVMTARHLRSRQVLGDAVLRTSRHHTEERENRRRAMELLEVFQLETVADYDALSLPYGSQRRLEIARALATDPKILLLDEPAAGMNPEESQHLAQLIRWLRDEMRLTILLVEHNMRVIMSICETIQVIDYGQTIAVGTPDEIQHTAKVIQAYLGSPVKPA